MWGGLDLDILTLLLEPWPNDYGADPSDDDDRVVFYRRLDEHEEANGEIVGVEIDLFLSFDGWEALADVPHQWQIDGSDPLPLSDLLRRLQVTLLERTKVAAHA